eukprot:1195520-Prorocentrum_minimum.AAC.7
MDETIMVFMRTALDLGCMWAVARSWHTLTLQSLQANRRARSATALGQQGSGRTCRSSEAHGREAVPGRCTAHRPLRCLKRSRDYSTSFEKVHALFGFGSTFHLVLSRVVAAQHLKSGQNCPLHSPEWQVYALFRELSACARVRHRHALLEGLLAF